MKTRIILLAVIASAIATGVLVADKGGNGKAKGWPNHGISSPGHPNHYAGPKPPRHP